MPTPNPTPSAPIQPEKSLQLMHPVRETGFNKSYYGKPPPTSGGAVRPIATRDKNAWECVTVLAGHETSTPQVQCKGCGKTFLAGATRIQHHVLGQMGSKKCKTTIADANFKRTVEAIAQQSNEKQAAKRQKTLVQEVNTAVQHLYASSTSLNSSVVSVQQSTRHHFQLRSAHM